MSSHPRIQNIHRSSRCSDQRSCKRVPHATHMTLCRPYQWPFLHHTTHAGLRDARHIILVRATCPYATSCIITAHAKAPTSLSTCLRGDPLIICEQCLHISFGVLNVWKPSFMGSHVTNAFPGTTPRLQYHQLMLSYASQQPFDTITATSAQPPTSLSGCLVGDPLIICAQCVRISSGVPNVWKPSLTGSHVTDASSSLPPSPPSAVSAAAAAPVPAAPAAPASAASSARKSCSSSCSPSSSPSPSCSVMQPHSRVQGSAWVELGHEAWRTALCEWLCMWT